MTYYYRLPESVFDTTDDDVPEGFVGFNHVPSIGSFVMYDAPLSDVQMQQYGLTYAGQKPVSKAAMDRLLRDTPVSSNQPPLLLGAPQTPKIRGRYTLPQTCDVIHLPAPSLLPPFFNGAHRTTVERLRKLMEVPKKRLDDLRRPRHVDTGKRFREWESAMHEARVLDILVDKLGALATGMEQGKLPKTLAGINWNRFGRNHLEILLHDIPTSRDLTTLQGIGVLEKDFDIIHITIMAMGDPDAGKERDAETMQRLEYLTDMSRIPGYFPTPRALIEGHLLAHVEVGPNVKILEPSAGKGSIAHVLREQGATHIDVVEWNHDLRAILKLKGFNVIGDDIFDESLNHLRGSYDAIVANPPFEKGADAQHVRRYVEFLRPGGTLVSVMSNSVQFQQAKQYVLFRAWLKEQGGQIYPLPAGSFNVADRKTGASVCYIVIKLGEQLPAPEPLPIPEPPRIDMNVAIREMHEARAATDEADAKVKGHLRKLYPDAMAQAFPEPEIKPQPKSDPDPDTAKMMQALQTGFSELKMGNLFEGIMSTLNQADMAEAEIELAMKRHPNQQSLMWGSFSTLRCRLPMTDMLYRAHCRELLNRIAAGVEYNTATDAECLATLMEISKVVPMHDTAAEAYGKLFARLFPGKFAELGEATKFITEKWEGKADDLIREVRDHMSRKLGKRDAPRPRLPDWMNEGEEQPETAPALKPVVNKEEVATEKPVQLELF